MGNKIVKSVTSYLILISIFVIGNGIFNIGFSFYWYYLIYIPFAVCAILVRPKLDKNIIGTLLVLILYSFLTHKYGTILIVKQIINISFSIIVFYFFLVFENFNLEEIVRKYVSTSKVVLVLGFIQVALFTLDKGDFFVGIFPFLRDSNISVRLQSVTQEPSFIAYTFCLVVFLSLNRLFSGTPSWISKFWAISFVVGYLLTFSSVAYIGLVLMLIVLYFRKITLLKLISLGLFFLSIFFLLVLAYANIPETKLRVDDTILGIKHGIFNDDTYKKLNLSTYAMLSNAYVAKKNISNHPVSGSGLGTHELAYDLYIPSFAKKHIELNREDANSLFLRLLSETGLFGLTVVVFFLIRYRIRFKTESVLTSHGILWIINNGIFIMFLLFLLRSGDYTVHGRILFLLIFYYSYLQFKTSTNLTVK